jgi:D-3-phosphoglycerate dehydrogenase
LAARLVSLSPYSAEQVQALFPGRNDVEVIVAPPPPAQDEVRRLIPEADLILGDKRHRHRLDRPELETMTRCRLIQQPAVGFDAVDHRAARELGIPVANAAGYNRDAVADWVIMAILNLLRHGAWGDRRMRAGGWPREGMDGPELGSLTVGIIGLGNVGGAVAARLHGFGSRVVYTDVVPRSLAGAERVSLEDLLAQADVVCVHTPLDRDTRGMIDAKAFARMKPTAYLVNGARGPIVDEAALLAALQSGRIAGAAMDVFEVEPLAEDSPLREMDNVFMSPHIGGYTHQAEARVLEVCAENLIRVLEGREPFNIVNTDVPSR